MKFPPHLKGHFVCGFVQQPSLAAERQWFIAIDTVGEYSARLPFLKIDNAIGGPVRVLDPIEWIARLPISIENWLCITSVIGDAGVGDENFAN